VVTNNTMTNNYVSAFQVKKSGTVTGAKLKGENERMKRNGFYTVSDCSTGALVNRMTRRPRWAFGGGDKGGNVVITPQVDRQQRVLRPEQPERRLQRLDHVRQRQQRRRRVDRRRPHERNGRDQLLGHLPVQRGGQWRQQRRLERGDGVGCAV
jgi:hypothetical protein